MNIDNTRLEMKVDELTRAINKLVLFEERQAVQALAIIENSKEIKEIRHKLDMWVNRGVGSWFIAVAAFTLWKTFAG